MVLAMVAAVLATAAVVWFRPASTDPEVSQPPVPAPVVVPRLTPSLRVLGSADGVAIGAAVNSAVLSVDPAYDTQLADQYDMVTPENVLKWAYTEPAPGRFSFASGDALVRFAQAHGMAMRGHTLVWFEENPAWLDGLTGARLARALRRHIRTEVSHWDVVNEAVDDRGGLRQDRWLDGLGPGYITDAFRWAHAADPGAVLFYNDYGIEAPGPKADAVYALLATLRAQGVPVGGVGFQLHTSPDLFSSAALATEMARFAGLGLDVAVTEMDVRLQPPVDSVALAAQADDFATALADCRAQPACHTFVTWGFTDAVSWVPSNYPGYTAALPFDAGLAPKPAAYGLQTELERASP
jgi:endo-1,4-beta-xylanase